MSTVANAALPTAGPVLMNSQSIPNPAEKLEKKVPTVACPKPSDSESDSDSETTTEDEDTSDDDERMADNPIFKERLKQLDRYATPLSHKTQSPDQTALSSAYATPLPLTECLVNSGPLSSHGKSSGPSDVVDSSSTPSEYRSHQPSVTESPNPCSGPASLNTSVTPKHNFSPAYGIHGGSGSASGPSSQHDQHSGTTYYSHASSKFPRKSHDGPSCGYQSSFPEGCETSAPDDQVGVREGNREFTCDICSAMYTNIASLRSHMKKHNHVAKRHQCEQCTYSTQYGKNLLKHIDSMHGKIQTDQFQCEGCARFFPTEDHLRDHECTSMQYNAYRCEECGRVFKTKLRLKYHADIHNPRKPYVCDVEGCDRAFRTPKYLRNHRDEFHRMQPKNYMCPVEGCELVFHRKTHLKRHIATHEDSEKKYHCQWPSCQRRFCSEETLSLHYRKHTGEKPFNCALCTYTCYNKPTLNEHYRLNHAKDSTVEGPYKSFNPPVSSPSCGVQRTSANTYDFNSRKDQEPTNVASSAPTSLPIVRHRMADILESCGTQPPGPLDAEINGILDSLDKESDLPDLFASSNFDFETVGPNANYRTASHPVGPNPPPPAYEDPAVSSSCQETRYSIAISPDVSGDQPRVLSSLEATLTGILADLQKADLSDNVEAFEEAKLKALSVLPKFTTGKALDQQLTTVLEEVLESFVGQPSQVLRAVFQTVHPFTREEYYMVESLEHQLMDDSPLVAPTPPRRRGRRPKLQQQLQPFLQRIFGLEPGTAEAMAADLVTSAHQERNISFCPQFSPTECVRGRGRGRGYRIRGRQGRPLSLTLKFFPDGTATRTQHEPVGYRRVIGGSVHRGSGMPRRMRSGIRGRYRIDRLSGTPRSGFQHSSPLGGNSMNASSPTDNLPLEPSSPNQQQQRTFDESHSFDLEDQELGYTHHRHNHHHDRYDADTPVQPEEIDATSMRLREIRKSSGESDEELDDLDDTDEGVDEEAGETYGKDLPQHAHPNQSDITAQRSTALDVAELNKIVAHKSGLYNPSDKESVNQDTLGEMLEDLGVIVKRIGERAAARRQPCTQESTSIYPAQPLNLAELPEDDQPADCSVASLLLNGPKLTRNRSDPSAPAIQLPSMAILASASAGTPTSIGEGSTPGCPSNAEPHDTSPHFSATHSQQPTSAVGPYGPVQSHTPVMSIHSDNQTVSSGTGKHPGTLSSTPLPGEFKTNESDYPPRPVPMWSCESMCCPTTRENCSIGPDKSAYSGSPSYDDGSVHRMSVPCSVEESGDNGQSFHPTDLSTRMAVGGYDNQSIHSPQASPSSPKHQQPGSVTPICGAHANGMESKPGLLPAYSGPLSSNTVAMDSLRSAVEAVDHLRSLSALGAKYTASLGMPDDPTQSQSYHHSLRFPVYPYTSRSTQPDESPQPDSVGHPDTGPSPTPPPHGPVQNSSGPNIFTPPQMPSALNNLLSRDQKTEALMNSPLGLSTGGTNGHCSPSKADFPAQTAPGSGNALCGYSPYHPSSLSSRCSSRGRNESSFHSLGLPAPTSACSSASSSSSSARSYLQDMYQQHQQRELQYHHHHQQQQHHHQHQQSHVPPSAGFSHHNSKSPVHELTTRQLLSEAAATAYAHGLGRCDTQGFMSGNNQGHVLDITSPRSNPYAQSSASGFTNPYNRYPTTPEIAGYGHTQAHSHQSSVEHGFHAAHLSGSDFSSSSSHGVTSTARSSAITSGHNAGGHYMGGHGAVLSDPYQLYSPHLRQSSSHMHPALSRSVDQQQLASPTHVQPQSAAAAAHLAHSIHEVSGLAAAYHAYHQYHQQQQAGRHGLGVPVPTSPVPTPGAHAHYHNLLNAQSRAYYPPPSGLDEQFSAHRELGLYTAHTERRDPKSAYLAETYRESQATSGRFLF